jgi:cytochrome c oxidase subunit 2
VVNQISPVFLVLVLVAASGCRRDELPGASPAPPGPAAASSEPLRVRVTGHDFTWQLRYPGPDRSLDTPDDFLTQRHLHLPMETDIELELRSDDFVYSLYLPDYELVEMAFPGRPFLLEFSTGSVGTSRLLGSQMCGYTHDELLGDIVVSGPADYRQAINR